MVPTGDFLLYMEGDMAHTVMFYVIDEKERNFAIVYLFANVLSGTIDILFVYVCIANVL